MKFGQITGTAFRRRSTRVAAGAAALAVVAAPLLQPGLAAPAQADAGDTGTVTVSPVSYNGGGEDYIGEFAMDGGWPVWCIQPGVSPSPTNAAGATYTSYGEQSAAWFDSHDGGDGDVTDANVRAANWAMQWYYDNVKGNRAASAAMQLYVWGHIAPDQFAQFANTYGYTGSTSDFRAMAAWAAEVLGQGEHGEIMRIYDQIEAGAKNLPALPAPGTAEGKVEFTIDPSRTFATAKVDLTGYFEGGTATVTLKEGTVFDANKNGVYDEGVDGTILKGIADGQTIDVPIISKDGNSVTPVAEVSATSLNKYSPALLEAYDTKVGGQDGQNMAGLVEPVSLNGSFSGKATAPITPYVSPVVTSQITAETQYVKAGESITDEWMVNFGEGQAWPTDRDNQPLPITLHGTIYGPFDEVPAADGGKAPKDAPVFQEIKPGPETTTTGDPVKVTSKPVTEGGYYVFVASVDEANQTDPVKERMTDGYAYSDTFGVANETALRIADVQTKAQETAPIMGDAVDTALINGHIPDKAGMRWTLFDNNDTPGDTSDDEIVGTAPIKMIPAGVYTGFELTSDPVNVGMHTGDLYWVEELLVDGKVEHKGEAELPNETTSVTPPKVTTTADPVAYVGTATFDTAEIIGEVPARTDMIFEYWHDVKGDTKPGDEASAADDVLLSTTDPVAVEPGKHDGTKLTSPEVKAEKEGRTYWVEKLRVDTCDDNGGGGSETPTPTPTPTPGEGEGDTPQDDCKVIIHEGDKGLENETTTVGTPHVETMADPETDVNEPFNDTAIIEGLIDDGTTLRFTAYQKPEVGAPKVGLGGQPTGEVWTAEELAKMTPETQCKLQTIAALDGVEVKPGEYTEAFQIESAEITTATSGTVYWVETLEDANGAIVHEGECGVPNETTHVNTPPETPNTPATESASLVNTGDDQQWILWVAAGAGVLAAASFAAYVFKARKRQNAAAADSDVTDTDTE